MVVSRDWSARREDWTPQSEDARDDGDIDYARVIHSASFRRLQGKTQILNLGDSDFYRTRLTHSLEVAQIAGGIARQLQKSYPDHPATPLLPDRGTIHSIGCTHDFGHPPFGHGGEIALNYCMRGAGGFEGNGQTLRILARLGNTLIMWTALQRMKVPSRLLVFPDAWHWITKPEDSRQFYREVHAWLAHYLKNGPVPKGGPVKP